jgi:hypothetical protein
VPKVRIFFVLLILTHYLLFSLECIIRFFKVGLFIIATLYLDFKTLKELELCNNVFISSFIALLLILFFFIFEFLLLIFKVLVRNKDMIF